MSPVKQALLAVKEMQAKIAAMEQAKAEPIAVVGMACHFPGNTNSPEELWDLLQNGGDGIIEVPKERWDSDSFYDSDPDVPGKMITRLGGFLKDIDQFDAGFFGISPREANSMDPHQRLLLQTTWEALENGGFDINGLYGSRTGVYVGISNFEYGAKLLWPENPEDITAYSGTGGSLGVTAGRLSYSFGFTGPSMIIDTACSSSLVTTHLAIQALRLGECDMAVSAGVNLIFGPQTHINFSKARMLAPDGHCKTFSADADGYARGEGAGVVLLKRLSDAERDGDTIIALLRGSAVNQDGPSGGLTVPNGPSQVKVIRAALENAQIDPGRVGYIEAHGTGTPLGDPIEIGALDTVFGNGKRSSKSPLHVASIKTNVGHLESAAGIAGIIKTILSLQYGQIPPHQNFKSPNPDINWEEVPVTVPRKLTEWVDPERVAGVSGFSFSGTNAHLVLSNYQAAVSETEGNGQADPATVETSAEIGSQNGESKAGEARNGRVKVGRSPDGAAPAAGVSTSRLLVLSSVQEANLNALSKKVASDLRQLPEEKWSDYCVSAARGRGHYNYRLALMAGSASEAADLLDSSIPASTGSVITGKRRSSPRRIAFLFTGQGAQYINMGRQLFEEEPCFRSVMEECDAIVTPLIGRSMLEMLYPESEEGLSDIDRTEFTQPLLFSVEYALAQLWRKWGIEPEALIGHSLGELTAATVSGLWSLEDALTLVCSRGRLMAEMCEEGAMAAVTMGEKEVTKWLGENKWASGISIASVNGPERVVVAGDPESIDRFVDEMTVAETEVKKLRVSQAFHSPLVEPMLDSFGNIVSGVTFGTLEIPVISNVTGDFSNSKKMASAGYWQDHIRQPVRFYQGLSRLLEDGINTFIEIGPKPTLSALGQAVEEELSVPDTCLWLPSMRYSTAPRDQLLQSLGQLYVAGVDVAATALNSSPRRYPVSLPTTPFVTERYWYKHSPVTKRSSYAGGHPLLGRKLSSPVLEDGSTLFVNEISVEDTAFLAHHKVFGEVVLPAAGHLEMALAASEELFREPLSVKDVAIQRALVLPEDQQTPVQTVVRPSRDGLHFEIYSRPDEAESWQIHTSGELSSSLPDRPEKTDLEALKERCGQEVEVETYYRSSRALGIEHGEDFQALKKLWQGEGEMLGRLELPSGIRHQMKTFFLSPVLLDAAFQMASYPLMEQELAFLPVGLEQLNRYGTLPKQVWCHTTGFKPSGKGALQIFETDIQLLNEEGEILAEVKGLRFQRAHILPQNGRDPLSANSRFADWLYEIEWRQKPLFGQSSSLLQTPEKIGRSLSGQMQQAKAECAFYGSLFADMDRLSVDFIIGELLRTGWEPVPGVEISADELVKKAGVADDFISLFHRCLEMLAEDGLLKIDDESLTVLKPFEQLPAEKVKKLCERFDEAGPEMTLFTRCAESLGAVWRGDVDPLSLLFPEGDLSVTALLYQHSVGARSINTLLADGVREAISQVPASRGLRILEIGGGTGGTTVHLLPTLPAERCDYLFTDISAHFTKQASKELAADYPFMRFETLDIEKEPAAELLGQFDLIIAANVVHATRRLGQTLENCKSLLAPGGQLVLLEASAKQRWLDLTFGMTEGWWRFMGQDPLRDDYPLLSPDQWKQLLPELGFGPVTLLGPDSSTDDGGLKQHVVIARKEEEPASVDTDPPMTEEPVGPWVIIGEDSDVLECLREELPGEAEQIPTSILMEGQAGYEKLKEILNKPVRGIILMQAFDSIETANEAAGDVPHKAVSETAGNVTNEKTATSISDPLLQQHHLALPVLQLARASGELEETSRPRLWMVTRDAIAVEGDGEGYYQASLHGLVRTLKSEHPDLYPVAIDLSSGVSPREAADIIRMEIETGETEEQVLSRESGRWVSRLKRGTGEPASTIEIQEESSYLITGGLGDIGLEIAKYLISIGARHLILMSRSKPDKKTRLVVRELEESGATIEIAHVDVTDETAVQKLVDEVERPPLRGVIHAAGTLADGVLANMEWGQFEKVLSAKIAGAWNLHQATLDQELDFFILFSSIGSIFGPAAQGNYAAANACMDQFAGFRRQKGLPALVLNWGTWSEIGLVARQSSAGQDGPMAGQVGAMKGITPISPADGVALFDALWKKQGQIVAVPAKWPVLFEYFSDMALLEQLRKDEGEKSVAAETKDGWLEELQTLPPGEQQELILTHVSEQVAQVLGAKVESLDVTAGFFDLGMDSLTSVEMRNALQKSLGRDLPSTLIFKYPTISAVAGFLAEEIIGSESTAAKTAESGSGATSPSGTTDAPAAGHTASGSDRTSAPAEGDGKAIGGKSASGPGASPDNKQKAGKSTTSNDDVNEMSEEELNALINDEFDNLMEDDS
ncbi:MAG: SDR family NAD(P)-dependent oxidoreductase [Balneolaceae bacterium]